MKQLLNTLYVLSENNYLSLKDENVIVTGDEHETIARIPLHTLESIVYCGYKGVSPTLLGECTRLMKSFCFLSPQGRFLARVDGEFSGNVLLRRTQYRVADDSSQCLKIAKAFIIGKVFNSRWNYERFTRDHKDKDNIKEAKELSQELALMRTAIMDVRSPQELLGVEGKAADIYFKGFNYLILNISDTFSFHGRSRRPPLDRVNALLSSQTSHLRIRV